MTALDKDQLLERMVTRLLADDSDTASTRVLAEKSEKIQRDVRSFNKAMAQPSTAIKASGTTDFKRS